ncbi:MAG: hypothetical protein NVS3B20_12040 [Polyangiales bacterium]
MLLMKNLHPARLLARVRPAILPIAVVVLTHAMGDVARAQAHPPSSSGWSIANLSDLEKRIALLEKSSADAKQELDAVGPKRAAATLRARLRGRVLYKLLRAGLMPLSGGFASFVDHAQRVERFKRAVKSDLGEEGRLTSRAASLASSLDGWTRERSDLSEKKGIFQAAKVALDEERRRNEAFDHAFATSNFSGTSRPSEGSADIIVYGPTGPVVPEGVAQGSFKSRKGRLTFPIAGQAEVKSTVRDGGPAAEIRATLGATVRAVHAGRVAFADRYGTYGSLIILDHGDRCYTVSGNLGSIDVKVGDDVSAGEKIGTVGDEGRGPMLYFEVRQGNEKVPPTAWLGL